MTMSKQQTQQQNRWNQALYELGESRPGSDIRLKEYLNDTTATVKIGQKWYIVELRGKRLDLRPL